MNSHTIRDERRSADLAWVDGVLPRAGIFWLEGRCHVAALAGSAERDLRERGAIPIATLTFDGSGGEGPPPGYSLKLHPLGGRGGAAALGCTPSRN